MNNTYIPSTNINMYAKHQADSINIPLFSCKLQKLLLWLMVITPLLATAQRVEFNAAFAPAEDFVKPVEQPYRQSICLNGSWKFQPIALQENFREGYDLTPDLVKPVSNQWSAVPIRIPSPWNVNSFANHNGLGGDFRTYPSYPAEWENIKMGWLSKSFEVPRDWDEKQVQLHFEAVAGDAIIYVNGKEVGKHFGIFLPFDVDVTNAIIPGKKNQLIIGIRKASLFDQRSTYGRRTYQAGSFWGQHIVGIWQDVYLVALPKISVSQVYINAKVNADSLETNLIVKNNSSAAKKISLEASAFRWLPAHEKTILLAPVPHTNLAKSPDLTLKSVKIMVPAHGEVRMRLSSSVEGKLKLWSPENPNLYGLVVKIKTGKETIDSKYTRFGWRQVTLKGKQFLLNGKPLIMKGDSWHFLGIPQMTRRYAWAWFTAMHNANLNAVRLHAQPYPSFYMDVADEMGILVLDETAAWASDGGPKLDDPAFWKDSKEHLKKLILRDRNHPSVFGWSISNEIMPVVKNVFHAPKSMSDTLLKYDGIWADICQKLDPSRPWISADGEDDAGGQLPTYIVHYGGTNSMDRGEKSGKPWGVGEAGNAYYGTPAQVAETNGDRAYESFLGRMEGVAEASYQSLVDQRKRNAIYRSVFNMVWYGLKPMPLGLKDTTRAASLKDGVFFTSFHENQPGVQPERLGPYSTTLNPGYDPGLPLYQSWPLFDAIHDASADHLLNEDQWKPKKINRSFSAPAINHVKTYRLLAGSDSRLKEDLLLSGLDFKKSAPGKIPELLIIDGKHPPQASKRMEMEQVYQHGGKVLIWGVDSVHLSELNRLLPAKLDITARKSSSLLVARKDPVVADLGPADLYFSELQPSEITDRSLSGPLKDQSVVLLEDCNTDWLRWNKQPEYAKTAMVLRSERESKPSGAVLIAKKMDRGTLLVTTLPAAPRQLKKEKVIRTLLTNIGVPLGAANDAGNPLLKSGEIERTLVCGSFPVASLSEGIARDFISPEDESIKENEKSEGIAWKLLDSENGTFDFNNARLNGRRENAVVYMSFWVSSPRSLNDLLIEPDMPIVNLDIEAKDPVKLWLNGQVVMEDQSTSPKQAKGLKIKQGWNHFLIKVVHQDGKWEFSGHFTSNQPEFLRQLDSAFEKLR